MRKTHHFEGATSASATSAASVLPATTALQSKRTNSTTASSRMSSVRLEPLLEEGVLFKRNMSKHVRKQSTTTTTPVKRVFFTKEYSGHNLRNILFIINLSYRILLYLILSYLILSYLILAYGILWYPMVSYHILWYPMAVSYTHLTLPTNREV